ncbi:hypothetical protein Syun_012537 [Stephania yunnanensis]|uniref:Reverse transcriptase domain-containing protein n=1 Tax=Stephania yunnanensis TaxID=152371 RepID=A0AAP0PGH2_9MAGN
MFFANERPYPFLFILVADFIRLMEKAKEMVLRKGFTVWKKETCKSHLLFAEDFLFLVDCSSNNVITLSQIIDGFRSFSEVNTVLAFP